eukprot:CAMPEP_0113305296 /NCGR_PEP_ID=MMETSP0010_2-20120614/4971_1 /TAXON_ID=216773 ORGANISM="Corethron hystrix, Strain 308" /NCGR_SAMPLE_ID=MMETSP0010_2 /ASSEMBLY_ACC=CAM_ASM_000155 /LENGTH=326 /DNA_ID=CAMNT_0000159669 /DNA_START=13 /DNA_END=993 /DNA_ORIENTATION=+ /assembly_acc=CAM_ASM_000155
MQRMAELADPEWAPFWVNYKMLKKIIKELPATINTTQRSSSSSVGNNNTLPDSPRKMGKTPGEITFFKLLHSELKKAIHFFAMASQEFIIREERIKEGIAILKQPTSILVNNRWSLIARSIYCFHKELLLLETYAIMTYCAFSKILKKHDKNTGYNTRIAFMAKVVNCANFTSYPSLLEMIMRSEKMYESVAGKLKEEGNSALYEDERLFINMIHRLNQQAVGTATAEGRKIPSTKREIIGGELTNEHDTGSMMGTNLRKMNLVEAHTVLKSLLEENEAYAADISSDDRSEENLTERIIQKSLKRKSDTVCDDRTPKKKSLQSQNY